MFEISALKEKKIAELQEIASKLGIDKITGLKKIDLAYKIIDHYAVNPIVAKDKKKLETNISSEKKDSKNEIKKDLSSIKFKNPNIKNRARALKIFVCVFEYLKKKMLIKTMSEIISEKK